MYKEEDAKITPKLAEFIYKRLDNNIIKITQPYEKQEINFILNRYLNQFDSVEIDVINTNINNVLVVIFDLVKEKQIEITKLYTSIKESGLKKIPKANILIKKLN